MKKGVIIYIAGDAGHPDREPPNIKETLNIDADSVEIVSGRSNGFDIHNAAWRMTAAGMETIVCLTAVYNASDDLRLTGRMMKLCG